MNSPPKYINSGLRYGRQGRNHQIVNPTLTVIMMVHGPAEGSEAAVGGRESERIDFVMVRRCEVNTGGVSVLWVGGTSVMCERGG